MPLTELNQAFKTLSSQDLIRVVITENKEFLEQMQREQLNQGKNAKGENLPQYKNKAYVRRKGSSAPGNRWNLKNKGVLHNSINLNVQNQTIEARRATPMGDVADKFEKQLGFLGFNDESIAKIIPVLTDKLLIHVEKVIFG